MEQFEKDFWADICKIYLRTKRYYILIEECSKDMKTVLQPIKEQRDALDHIVRSYSKLIEKEEALGGKEKKYDEYIRGNFSKAKGHIYRAFYDTADILTIILREQIRDYLSKFSFKDIKQVWDDYDTQRLFLINVNKEIAQLRILKDVVSDSNQKESMLSAYDTIIDNLFEIYLTVSQIVYPALAAKYKK